MALVAKKNRSDRIIGYHGSTPIPWPKGTSQLPSQQGTQAPVNTIDGLMFEYAAYGDVRAFIGKWHPVLDQTVLCHWTRHVAEGLQYLA